MVSMKKMYGFFFGLAALCAFGDAWAMQLNNETGWTALRQEMGKEKFNTMMDLMAEGMDERAYTILVKKIESETANEREQQKTRQEEAKRDAAQAEADGKIRGAKEMQKAAEMLKDAADKQKKTEEEKLKLHEEKLKLDVNAEEQKEVKRREGAKKYADQQKKIDEEAAARRKKEMEEESKIKIKTETAIMEAQAKADVAKHIGILEEEANFAATGGDNANELLRQRRELEKANFAEKSKHDAEANKEIGIKNAEYRAAALEKNFKELMKNAPKIIGVTGAAVGVSAISIYLFKNVFFPTLSQLFNEYFTTPSLFSETNWKRSFFGGLQKVNHDNWAQEKDLVFDPKLKEQLDDFVQSLKNSMETHTPLLNICLFGPPGTGKTAFARIACQKSGMLYSFMSGGDIQKMLKSGKAPEQLIEAINTAKKLGKPMGIFFDEAEAGLPERARGNISDELLAFITTFLSLTGTEDTDICFIFATNHPKFLDKAVRSRVSMFIEFELPGKEQRITMLKNYMKKHLLPKRYNIKDVAEFTDDLIVEFADKTEGLSGRDISYLMLSLQKAAMATKGRVLTQNLIRRKGDIFIAAKKKEIGDFDSSKMIPAIAAA